MSGRIALPTTYPSIFNVDAGLAAGNGFKLTTSVASGQLGGVVASAGDFLMGDEKADLIVRAWNAGVNAGAAYVVFGGGLLG